MALSLDQKRVIAFNRFGLGARPGSFAAMTDPKAALLKELDTPGIALIPKTSLLPTYAEACLAGEKLHFSDIVILRREIDARFEKHGSVPIGFVERLVLFFANHFSLSNEKKLLIERTQGQFEREVIRRHVLGTFPGMLLAVMQHPAMVAMLDNRKSVGPLSAYGFKFGRGNNQNLAREILELYTIGSGAGYTQEDVENLALIMTGWSYPTYNEGKDKTNGGTSANIGQFLYRHDWHQPGTIKFMGVDYPPEAGLPPSGPNTFSYYFRPTGGAQGIAVLKKLALSPATAEHLAFKLCRHFITDKPTPKMIAPLAAAYMASGGNLKAVAKALVNLPEAWSWPLTKFRTPYETVAAQYRALNNRHWPFNPSSDKTEKDARSYKTTKDTLRFLNQVTWECVSPEGWPDETAAWLNPDALRVRTQTAWEMVNAYYDPAKMKLSGIGLARDLVGRTLSFASRQLIQAEADRKRAIALLFVTPEFQRR